MEGKARFVFSVVITAIIAFVVSVEVLQYRLAE
jgi:hypothetical protein